MSLPPPIDPGGTLVVPTPDSPAIAGRPAQGVEPWGAYARGQLASLGLELMGSDAGAGDGGGYEIIDPAAQAEPTAPDPGSSGIWKAGLKTRRRKREEAPTESAVLLTSDSPREIIDWLAERLSKEPRLTLLEPVGEPQAVHEIVAPMFEAYTVDGGAIHLSGCHLELAPVLRLTRLAGDGSPRVEHSYYNADGGPIPAELAEQLNLSEVGPPAEPRPGPERGDWVEAIGAATAGDNAHSPAIAALLVVKRASGHLQATIGEESLGIAFAGWARTLSAAAAICPETGVETFHLTALADGRIVAAEETIVCEQTGERILTRDSVVCSGTGKRVAAACCEPCSVTGEPTLPAGLARCPRCGQRVSRRALAGRGCKACERLEKAPKSDPRLEAVLAAAPKLAGRGSWRFAETESVLIAEKTAWLQRTLVVIDKSTGELLHAATAGRFSVTWDELPLSQVK